MRLYFERMEMYCRLPSYWKFLVKPYNIKFKSTNYVFPRNEKIPGFFVHFGMLLAFNISIKFPGGMAMLHDLYKPKRHWKEIELWKDVTDDQWNNWLWQLTNTIRTVDDLKKVIHLTPDEEEGVRISTKTIPLNITPYYASLMNPDDPRCPIRMQSVPISAELNKTKYDMEDPLHEDEDSPVPGLTHRYPDRVLFLVTNQCSMYCRYCTRRRFSGQIGMGVPKKQLDAAIQYIRETPAVRDVLLSGGDGLLINDTILEYILKNLREIPHVEIIRIGTRAPVVFPRRAPRHARRAPDPLRAAACHAASRPRGDRGIARRDAPAALAVGAGRHLAGIQAPRRRPGQRQPGPSTLRYRDARAVRAWRSDNLGAAARDDRRPLQFVARPRGARRPHLHRSPARLAPRDPRLHRGQCRHHPRGSDGRPRFRRPRRPPPRPRPIRRPPPPIAR